MTCPTLVLIIEPPAVRTAPDDPCFGAAGAVGEVRVPTQDVVLLATLGLTVFHFTRFTGTAGRPAAHWQGPCTEPIGSGGLGCFDEAGPSQWRRP